MSNAPEEKMFFTHVVIVEWGGKKPSTTFYNRLHEYGLYSRGPADRNEVSLLEWRDNQKGSKKTDKSRGIVLQEGVIVVSSATLAKDIAAWAKDAKAEFVMVGDMTLTDFVMSDKDFKHYEKIQQKVSKRGPKVVADAGTYSVTCRDEVMTFIVNANAMPWNCPSCGGSNCEARLGQRPVFPATFDGTREEYWLKTRFSNGVFEVPELSYAAGVKAPRGNTTTSIVIPRLNDDLANAEFKSKIDTENEFWMRVTDTLYCVSLMTSKARLDGRISTIEAYVRGGGEKFVSFVAPASGHDMIDLAILDTDFAKYIERA